MGQNLKVGVSKIVITPPVGFRLSGYEDRTQGSIGVHDDLYATALVLDDGAEKIAVVSCDLIGVTKEITKRVRQEVEAELDIRGDAVMVAATHTHAGPDFTQSNGDYLGSLAKKIAGSIKAAFHNLVEAEMGAGRGEAVIGYNRRNPKDDYFLTPYPEGVNDHEVNILSFNNRKGELIATVTNTACHAVVLGSTNLLISADYPGYAKRVVERLKGGVALFLNGCCGNINPVHTDGGHTVINGKIVTGPALFREAERLGNILGGEALKVVEQIETTIPEAKLRAKRSEVSLSVRHDIPKRMLEMFKQVKPTHPRFELYQNVLEGKDITTEVQAMAIGDMALVGVPGEAFTEFGLEIKKRSPFKYTLVSELANDVIGYVPVAKAFKEGGYEPTSSIVTPNAGTKITEAAIGLLEAL